MDKKDYITGEETLMERGKALRQAPTRCEPEDLFLLDTLNEVWSDDVVEAVERMEKGNRAPDPDEREPEMG